MILFRLEEHRFAGVLSTIVAGDAFGFTTQLNKHGQKARYLYARKNNQPTDPVSLVCHHQRLTHETVGRNSTGQK